MDEVDTTRNKESRMMTPVYALAMGCDPELALANNLVGKSTDSGVQDSKSFSTMLRTSN